jgi:hypothetical protein
MAKRGWYVSTFTGLTRVDTKRQALDIQFTLKDEGRDPGVVLRECICGCGKPASKQAFVTDFSKPWECPCCGQRAQRRGCQAAGQELHASNCSYAYMHNLPRAKLLSLAERYDLAAKGQLR